MQKRSRSWRSAIFWVFPILFLIGFYFYPLAKVVERTVGISGALQQISQSDINLGLRALGFSFYQAALSTVLTLILGLPSAYLFGRFKFRGRQGLRLLTTLPFILPTVVVAAGFNALVGPKGWINLLFMRWFDLPQPPIQIFGTFSAILLAHVFYNTSVIVRVVGTAWERLNVDLENAGRMLSASPWRIFRRITFPLLLPSIISGALLVFLFNFTSFGVILLMGGARYSTVEVEIYIQTLQFLNLKVAGLLASLQLTFSMAFTWLSQRIDQDATIPIMPVTGEEGLASPDTWKKRMFVTGMIAVVVVFFGFPLLALLLRSLTLTVSTPAGDQIFLTLEHYRQIFINERDALFFVPPFAALRNSVLYALFSTMISMLVGILIAVNGAKNKVTGGLLNALVMLPLGTSAVTLGLGYLLAFSSSRAFIAIYPILIPLAHALIALPFTVRILQPAINAIPQSQHEAAIMLGVPENKLWWKLDLPMMRKPLATAAIYAFAISLGEFGATTFLARPELPTMPVAIFRYLGLPGAENYGKALAMAALLLLICTGGFILIEKLQKSNEVN